MSVAEWLVVLLVLILSSAFLWATFDLLSVYKKDVLENKDKGA